MSTAAELIDSIRMRGVRIWTEDGNIRVHGNVQALPAESVERLRSRKAEIVHHLQQTQSAEEIPRLPRGSADPIPLTATQLVPWHFTLRPRSRARLIALAQRIHGRLQIETLARAISALQRRHEALRIRISGHTTEPKQYALPAAEQELELVDLSASVNAEPLVNACLAEFVAQKIDYATDPLFITRVIKVNRDEHILVGSIDHLVSDGVSNEILRRELWEIYEALAVGRDPDLAILQVQFLDHASWLQRTYPCWLRSSGEYWKRRLGDAEPAQWPLPPDRASQSEPFVSQLLSVDGRLRQRVLDIAQSNRTLPAFVVLTAYIAAALRWCDRDDLTVAISDLGRHRPELVPIVGCLTHHLPLRIQLPRGESFLTLLEVVRTEFNAASRHRDFDQVSSVLPQFHADIYFNWVPQANLDPTGSDGLKLQTVALKSDQATALDVERTLPFKVILVCANHPDRLAAALHSSTTCFNGQSAEQFSVLLLNCMRELCDDPAAAIRALGRQ